MERKELVFETFEEWLAWYDAQKNIDKPYSFLIGKKHYLNLDMILDEYLPTIGICPNCGEVRGKGSDMCLDCRDYCREIYDERRIDEACGK
jgi:hypothetical protein